MTGNSALILALVCGFIAVFEFEPIIELARDLEEGAERQLAIAWLTRDGQPSIVWSEPPCHRRRGERLRSELP